MEKQYTTEKIGNQERINFVRTRSVMEKLMLISETTLYGKGNMQE